MRRFAVGNTELPPWPPVQDAKFIELVKQGASLSEIKGAIDKVGLPRGASAILRRINRIPGMRDLWETAKKKKGE